MKRAKLAEILRKDYVQTVIIVVIMIVSVVAFWYGLKFAFGTEHPLLAVASGSMEPVLYKGDLILVQGVHNACKINAAPRDAETPGDIIVFHRPGDPKGELIVHRAVNKTINSDGSCSFRTQGDRSYIRYGYNPDPWGWVKESDIVGKVVEVDAPIWTHSYVFWVIILATGVAAVLGGVLVLAHARIMIKKRKTNM